MKLNLRMLLEVPGSGRVRWGGRYALEDGAIVDIDRAFEAAKAILEEASSRLDAIRSEEDAKIQIITRLLTEVLGWSHSDISAEHPNDNGFSDYLLTNDERPEFVLEAKRIGVIELETKTVSKSYYKISGPVLKPALEGIKQAASYCYPIGAPLAVVTDGILWIVFLPWVPQASYLDRQAIVFPGISSVLNDFTAFYELLSKEHAGRGTFRVIFDAIHENRLVLNRELKAPLLASDNRIVQKSPLSFDLENVFDGFFSSLAGDRDPSMLIDCFVESRESRIADFSLERLTKNVLGNIDPAERDVGEGLQDIVQGAVAGEIGQTVFIIGPSGAGKSTFLDRFFARTLAPEIRAKCVVAKIDILDASGDESTVLQWITNRAIALIEQELFEGGIPDWNDLQGLYHLEYLRRAKGVDAALYQRDKNAFKEKFARYVEEQVEKDREGYLRRLVVNTVRSRKRLPIFVIDNTDEFPLSFKEVVFQYFQSLRREADHSLVFFPVTDRSAWSFSKTDIFNIYSSKSFFLPTPPPREVFRARVDYIRDKWVPDDERKTAGDYLTVGGIRIKIRNLATFAAVIESVFVNQDYPSRTIGDLSNYNMRKALGLAKRVITSSVLDLEDLVRSYLTGEMVAPSAAHFVNALVKGDYLFFKSGEEPLLFPLYQVDFTVRQSPLIFARVLILLSDLGRGATEDADRYMSVSSILAYFGVMAVPEAATQRALEALLVAGLLEPYDLSKKDYSDDQRLAITFSGVAHLRLGLYNPVFFEQLALTTRIADPEVTAQMRGVYFSSASLLVKLERVRELFASYLASEDERLLKVPDRDEFRSQAEVCDKIRSRWISTSDAPEERWRPPDLVGESVTGTVENFDRFRGFGFVDLPSLHDSAFLHSRILEQGDFPDVSDGDRIVCDVQRNDKGLVVSKVHEISAEEGIRSTGTIVKLIPDRGYGFVNVPELDADAFFHYHLFKPEERASLSEGQQLTIELKTDPQGRPQVRRVL